MIRSQSYCFSGIITIFLFFFLHPLLNTFAFPTRSLCRHDQRDALLEVEKEFSIPPDESWNKSVDCCSWWGIKCDAILGEVISLELRGYGINTSLKPSSAIFKLQHLRYLDLSECSLQGEISSYIGNLSQLEYLGLSDNHLVGELPDSIGNLNQLRYLDLTGNGFKGNIPSSFANFTKLSELVLRGNKFTSGALVLANLTSLSSIDLSYNLFNSSLSVDLSGLHNLSEFQGNDNSFVGPFPSSLLMISSLTWIDLSRNQLEGHLDFGNTSSLSKLKYLIIPVNKLSGLITESISKFHDLFSLDLSHNRFQGPIPRSISKLSNLQTLDLSHNSFVGTVPTSISKLSNLQTLDLSHNSFVGTVPTSMSKLVNLNDLILSYNQLEGEVPQFLGRSSSLWNAELSHNSFSSFGRAVQVSDGASLQVFDLGSNSIQGPFPQWVCMLTSLYALVLSNNHFTGPIPPCLKNSTSLRDLRLRNNSLTGTLVDFNSSGLRSLDVSRNSLVGKLPRSLVNCPLELLNVRENKIKDTFPFWLESLVVLVLRSNEFYGPVYKPSLTFESMRVIDISNNNFVGSLPQDYFANFPLMSEVWMGAGKYMLDILHDYVDSVDLVYKGVDLDFVQILIDFKAVDFSGNRFFGQIPGSVGLMSSVVLLNLSGNAFTGNIPPSLANITTLEALDLSRNNLSGKIPHGVGNLSFLSYVNFSHNHLVGLVPQSTQFKTQKCSSFLGNPGLYGLEEICGHINVPVPTVQQQPEESLSEAEEPVVNWIAAAIAYGPGVFCGLVIGYIFFSYKT